MNFQIVSDLHLEIESEERPFTEYVKPSAKILIIAGDIHRIYMFERLKKFISDACENFEKVLYVLGNHEYYTVSGIEPVKMSELYFKLRSLYKEFSNFQILSRSHFVIGDICVIGCTLWSNAKYVPNYVRIHGMNTRFYNKLHCGDLEYIKTAMQICKEKSYKLVVVTHHSPSLSVLDNKSRFKDIYGSDLDYLLNTGDIHTWIFGHTHKNVDIIYPSGTRLVSNQKGKPNDRVCDFSLDKVISI